MKAVAVYLDPTNRRSLKSVAKTFRGVAGCSLDSIRRALKHYCKLYSVSNCVFLTEEHQAARLTFAAQMLHYPDVWRSLTFTDEKLWIMDVGGASMRSLYATTGRDPRLKIPTSGRSAPRYMTFGFVGLDGGTPYGGIVFLPYGADGATDSSVYAQLLRDHVLPQLPPGAVFQQDGARIHHAEIVARTLLTVNRLPVWPARSPDISVIERVWALAAQDVKSAIEHVPTTAASHRALIVSCFQRVVHSPGLISRLYEEAWGNLGEVVRRGGGNEGSGRVY